MKTILIIDAGHGQNTPGKCSPDRSFLEWKWNREIAAAIIERLRDSGHTVFATIGPEENDDVTLGERCRRANTICQKYGAANCAFVSIHANAAGGDGKWHSAVGWCAYTSKGQTAGDKLADFFYDAAEAEFTDRRIRKDMSDGDRDWEENFYVLRHTACPAVLTENFFYDNKEECEWLLSDDAKRRIVDMHCIAIYNYVKSRLDL